METKKLIIAACLQPEIGTDVGDVMTTWRHVEYMLLHAIYAQLICEPHFNQIKI